MSGFAFRLAHLSDPHLGPLPPLGLADWSVKRATGMANWYRSRRWTQDMRVLDALVADVAAAAPDEIALTGDVANIGLPAEFLAGRELIERLGPPAGVSFVPGNHDLYVAASGRPLVEALGDWMRGDDGAPDAFPWVRRRGQVAIVGLNSAAPTLPLLATGRLGRNQVEAAGRLLAELGREGYFRIVVVHHAPHRGGSRPMRNLTDAVAFEAMLAASGAELVLHGHNHRTSIAHRPGTRGLVPIVGVGSASAAGGTPDHRASWHLVTVAERDGGLDASVRRRVLAEGTGFVDAGELTLAPPAR